MLHKVKGASDNQDFTLEITLDVQNLRLRILFIDSRQRHDSIFRNKINEGIISLQISRQFRIDEYLQIQC